MGIAPTLDDVDRGSAHDLVDLAKGWRHW